MILKVLKLVFEVLKNFRLVFENRRMGSCVIDMAGRPHLNDLELIGDIFEDQEFHKFISNSPLLETLNVEYGRGLDKVMISSNLLKELLITHCANLKAIDINTLILLCFFVFFFHSLV